MSSGLSARLVPFARILGPLAFIPAAFWLMSADWRKDRRRAITSVALACAAESRGATLIDLAAPTASSGPAARSDQSASSAPSAGYLPFGAPI